MNKVPKYGKQKSLNFDVFDDIIIFWFAHPIIGQREPSTWVQ